MVRCLKALKAVAVPINFQYSPNNKQLFSFTFFLFHLFTEMSAEDSSNKPMNRIHTRSAGPVPSTSTAWTSSSTSKKNKQPSTIAENSVQQANDSQPITASHGRGKSYRSGKQ